MPVQGPWATIEHENPSPFGTLGHLTEAEEAQREVYARPIIGRQVISTAKIRFVKALPERALIDAAVDEISSGGPPEKIDVFWEPHGWQDGYVSYQGCPSLILALRELQFLFVTCDVQIKPGSGLMGDPKLALVDEIREEMEG